MPKQPTRLLSEYHDLVKEWHPSKNGKLLPSDVTHGSAIQVWWRCGKNKKHEWQAAPYRRAGRGDGCPFCSGKRVDSSNALSSTHPKVAKEWHKTKNGSLTAADVTTNSNKSVWWQCGKDKRHEWEALVMSRTAQNTNCPFCSNHRTLPDSSLAAKYPHLAREWHKTKNGNLRPEQVAPRSGLDAWWQCKDDKDHIWRTVICNRTRKNPTGCPYCANRKIDDKNSLLASHPELAKEWHKSKNGTLSPSQVSSGAMKRVWWQCPKDKQHEWQATIYRRSCGQGCPFCSHRRVNKSNALSTTHPEVAKQWHKTKNGNLTPAQVTAGSNKRVWWQCPADPQHQWQFVVAQRTKIHKPQASNQDASNQDVSDLGTRCPYCFNRKVDSKNSLAALYPLVAQQWHKTLNGKLKPSDVVAGSGKKVWWRCLVSPKHVWQTRVSTVVRARRDRLTTGCPFCFREDAKIYAKHAAAKSGSKMRA